MNARQLHAPSYRHVAWVYDALASGYSLGAIDRAKKFHHAWVNAGDRVLYAGAGRGREIVGALLRGAEVTCVEPCPAMAMRLHRRLSAIGDHFTILPKPIQSILAEPTYDLVVAHFFLNVFDEPTMSDVLRHLCQFIKPGGRIVIADFKPALNQAGWFDRAWRALYYRPLNIVGRGLGICALHPIYNYTPHLLERGLPIESRQAFRVLPCLPPMVETLVGKRKKEPPSCDGGY